MNVLSLFDGISCGRVALERAGAHVKKYYAAEIDKHAIKVSQKNWPDAVQLGDVQNWRTWSIDWNSIDLVLAGFPCQAWSVAGKQLGDRDERGMLFWVMLDIIKNCPNASFLIENVRMKKEFEEYITHHTRQALGNEHKILINSALVSAQNRPRYYWTSWGNVQPNDKGIVIGDITLDKIYSPTKSSGIVVAGEATDIKGYRSNRSIVSPSGKCPTLVSSVGGHKQPKIDVTDMIMGEGWHKWFEKNKEYQLKKGYCKILTHSDKAICMTARQYASWNGNFMKIDGTSGIYRKLTPIECERLQTLPDGYTEGVSNTQRYKALGNGWTVDVITHLLKGMS